MTTTMTDADLLQGIATLGLVGLADLLSREAPPPIVQQTGPLCGVYVRPMQFRGVGCTVQGHKHHYDHVTQFTTGDFLVVVDADAFVVRSPFTLPIPAEKVHRFTLLSERGDATCIFALVNKAGQYVGDWDGNHDPYRTVEG